MKKQFLLILSLFAFIIFLTPTAGQTAAAESAAVLTPQVFTSEHHDTSLPLRAMKVRPLPLAPIRLIPRFMRNVPGFTEGAGQTADPALDLTNYPARMPAPLGGWDGVGQSGSFCNCLPPDTNGDVGLNHYVQTVNTALQVWSKNGTSLLGPIPNNTLFDGFGGVCEGTNDGDPIVLYDPLARRWLFSQFALPTYPVPPFYQCIAVSATDDPTGAWHRYQFKYPKGLLNDYPKFGVWRDGYYMTANQFNASTEAWKGTGVMAFQRSKMLNGEPAQVIYFDLGPSDWGGMLPSDVDGGRPPKGTPNYFIEVQDRAWDPSNIPQDRIQVYAFRANWANPAASTFTNIANLKTQEFNGILCGFSRNCIPQKGTSRRLDAIGDRSMYRAQYRNFGTYATIVTNHSVNVGSNRAGVRWYEIRITNGTPALYQQGTHAPGTLHRWMGSAALDKQGNLAVGFSASASDQYPMLRYAGRLAGDPLNTLARGERTLKAGGGAQTSSSSRWGDYSMLAVDPADNCTFWYTNEYYSSTSDHNWKTWIGKFKFPSCS